MRWLLVLCTVFILFSGCVSETEYSEQESETLLSSAAYDQDEDGIIDFYHYVFKEEEFEDYSIKRQIYVYPENSISSFDFEILDEHEVLDALTLFDDYSDQLKSEFEECSKKVGIATTKCANVEHCTEKCLETSGCKKLAETYPDFMGYLIISLDQASSERISLTNSINADLWDYASLSTVEKKELFDNLNSLYLLGSSVLNGPLYTHEEVNLCSHSFGYYSYNELSSLIGVKELTPTNYKYLVVLEISRPESEEEQYLDLFVKEEIATSFVGDSLYLVQEASVEDESIEWSPVRSDKSKEILFYEYDSTEAPNPAVWKTPGYKIRSIDLMLLQPSFFLFSIFLPISNYYVALSLSIAVPAILLIILVNLILLAYNVVRAEMEKKTIYRAMKNFVGVPNLRWKKDLVFGAVLFVIGLGASFFAEHVTDETLQIFNLVERIFEDYVALISVFCTVVGSLFMFVSVNSMAKGIILRYSYEGVQKKEKESVLKEVEELKEKREQLKNLIEDYRKKGFDVTEAYNVYVSIPTDRISKITYKNIEHETRFIESSLHKIENVLSLLNERKDSTEKNWPEWSKAIMNLFQKEETIHLSSMNFVPYSLRNWAANKFISEHPEMGIVFEGESMKKKEISPDELIQEVLKSGFVLDALVLKDGEPFLAAVNTGNKTVMQGLLVKLSTYLRTFLKKSNQKEYKYVMGISNTVVFALVKREELESLIICPTDKFKEGFEQWKVVLDRLQSA